MALTVKLILAPLTGGKRDALTLANAFAVGAPFEAHIRGLFVRPDVADALPFFGDEVAPAMATEIVDAAREAGDEASAAARAALDDAARTAGYEVLEIPAPGRTASYFEMNGHMPDGVARTGLLADLIVFGPLMEDDRPGLTEVFETALLKSGKPVLLGTDTPVEGFSRIAIGWNGSAASAHAVSAALPLLAKAKSVQVITVQSGSSEIEIGAVEDYLRVHGIAAEIIRAEAQSQPIGQTLMETSIASGAELLVIGGYGHSRLREWLAGGVTRRLLSQAKLPLFLVH